jgi:hypothetical protein
VKLRSVLMEHVNIATSFQRAHTASRVITTQQFWNFKSSLLPSVHLTAAVQTKLLQDSEHKKCYHNFKSLQRWPRCLGSKLLSFKCSYSFLYSLSHHLCHTANMLKAPTIYMRARARVCVCKIQDSIKPSVYIYSLTEHPVHKNKLQYWDCMQAFFL